MDPRQPGLPAPFLVRYRSLSSVAVQDLYKDFENVESAQKVLNTLKTNLDVMLLLEGLAADSCMLHRSFL